jgi:hypothetical protein
MPAPPVAWERLSPRTFPGPYGDIAALSQGEAVVVAGDGLWRVGPPGPLERVCDLTARDAVHAVQADGDRFVALGTRDGEAAVWSSSNRGRSCHHSLLSASARRIFLRGDQALAWSPQETAQRSQDGGEHWQLLPDLEGITELALGPSGALYGAASLGPYTDRVRWFYLAPEAEARWVPSALGTRRGPSAMRARGDGTALLADASGTARVEPGDQVTTGTPEVLGAAPMDRPLALAEAGDARFIALAERHFRVVTAEGSRPLAALPGLRRATYFDAADDGTVWATDLQTVWRQAPGETFTELNAAAATELEPLGLAAEGAHVAVLSRPGTLAQSHDGGGTFHRVRLPLALGLPTAVSLTPAGVALVLGPGGLVIAHGDQLTLLELPGRTGSAPGQASVAVLGDRWVVCDGDVYTTDDEGRRWTQRFGPAGTGVPTGPRAVAMVVRGGGALLLDHEYTLWTSVDAVTTFRRLERDHPIPSAHPGHWPGVPLLAWDGAQDLAVLNRHTFARSGDGGRTFTLASAPFTPRATFMTPAGRLLVVGEPPQGLPRGCNGDGAEASAAMESADGWRFPPAACENLAGWYASAGGRLLAVTRAGVLRAISTARPWPLR